LQQEYDEMVVERRENDKQIEEVRDQANQVEVKVRTNAKMNPWFRIDLFSTDE
jgi:kinetochore protein Nuf2